MELTELSLAPAQFVLGKSRNSSSSSESENGAPSRKRKFFSDQYQLLKNGPPIQASVDLHVKDPLPLDWEQCLDLESGRMYYLNRKTLRKSWNWPKNQKLDLELNMSSTIPNFPDECSSSTSSLEDSNNKNHASSNSNMVALACLNCHLLVIFSKSSPSCPNCKYVHSFPTLQSPQRKVTPATRSLSTLSLLN